MSVLWSTRFFVPSLIAEVGRGAIVKGPEFDLIHKVLGIKHNTTVVMYNQKSLVMSKIINIEENKMFTEVLATPKDNPTKV